MRTPWPLLSHIGGEYGQYYIILLLSTNKNKRNIKQIDGPLILKIENFKIKNLPSNKQLSVTKKQYLVTNWKIKPILASQIKDKVNFQGRRLFLLTKSPSKPNFPIKGHVSGVSCVSFLVAGSPARHAVRSPSAAARTLGNSPAPPRAKARHHPELRPGNSPAPRGLQVEVRLSDTIHEYWVRWPPKIYVSSFHRRLDVSGKRACLFLCCTVKFTTSYNS